MTKKLPIGKKHSMWPFSSFFEDGDFFTSFPMTTNMDNTGLTISEDKTHLVIEAALPGLSSDDIEISMEKNTIWIKGDRSLKEEDKERHYYKKCHRSYSYAVPLPKDIDEKQDLTATYEDGMIIIKLAKTGKTHSRKIPITPRDES